MSRLSLSGAVWLLLAAACSAPEDHRGQLESAIHSEATHQAVPVGRSDPDIPLGIPSEAFIDDKGWLHVSDFLSPTVFVMDSTGSIRFTWGGRGDGPGEFRRVSSMSRGSDGRIIVYDRELRRITTLEPAGMDVVSTRAISSPEAPIHLLQVDADRWLEWHRPPFRTEEADPEGTDVLKLIDGTGEVVAPDVLIFRSPATHVVRASGAMLVVTDPFGSRPLLALTPNGEIVLASTGSVGFDRYAVVDSRAEIRAEVRAQVESDSAGPEEIEEMFLGEPGGGFSTLPDELQAAIRRSASSVPPLLGMTVDDEGNVWLGVRGVGVPAGRWIMLSPAGGFLLSLDLGSEERVVAHRDGLLVTLPVFSPVAEPVVRIYRIR